MHEIYTMCLWKKVSHFYFSIISAKVFIIFSLLSSEKEKKKEAWIRTNTSPQICCHATLQKVYVQLNSFTVILAIIISYMSGDICFKIFICLFFFPTLASLQHYCDNLFVALDVPFNYEGKPLPQHWTMHNWQIHWPVACIIQSMNMWFKQTF